MIISKVNIKSHLPFIIFFAVLIFTGLLIYKDYGISWDEPISHDSCGKVNYDFIKTGNYEPLITGNEKYHGPVFEIFLIYAENWMNLSDPQSIYRMRHLATFFLFAFSILFFYRIVYNYSKSAVLSLLGCVFLVLSPRIFAESFYNSKDLALLSMAIICIYTTLAFLRSRSFLSIFFHAMACAILIDIRIIGIIFPVFTIIFSILKYSYERRKIKLFTRIIPYLILLIPLIILCWPVLWKHPLDNFIAAFNEMKKYSWDAPTLFNGQYVRSINLPWQYIPVWVGITTPLFYLILFFTGLFFFFRQVFQTFKIDFRLIVNYDSELLNLFVVFFPVISVISLNSVMYDGWRHLYFIYPSVIFFTIVALKNIFQIIKKIHYKYLTILAIAFSLTTTVYSMIILHPYQNVYFNYLTRSSLNSLKHRFEMDYWGLSFYEGLRWIVANDKRDVITICEETFPGESNAMLLNEKDRNRLVYTSSGAADYFVVHYRLHPDDYPDKELFSVVRGDCKLMSVLDLHPEKRKNSKIENSIFKYEYDFNEVDSSWSGLELVKKDSTSDDLCSTNRNTGKYSAAYIFNLDSLNKYHNEIKSFINFNIYSDSDFHYMLVVQADSASGGMYFWDKRNLIYSKHNKWNNVNALIDFPDVKQGDKVKIYLYTDSGTSFMLDDFKMTVFALK